MDQEPKTIDQMSFASILSDFLIDPVVLFAYVTSPIFAIIIIFLLILSEATLFAKGSYFVLMLSLYLLNHRIREYSSIYDEVRSISSAAVLSFFVLSFLSPQLTAMWRSFEGFSDLFMKWAAVQFMPLAFMVWSFFLVIPLAKIYDRYLMKPGQRQLSRTMKIILFLALTACAYLIVTLTNMLSSDEHLMTEFFVFFYGGTSAIYAGIVFSPNSLKKYLSKGTIDK